MRPSALRYNCAVQLIELHTFALVAETLSFSRAAERLHLTSSAVVRRIQRLERGMGVRLLERSTVRVALTPVGVRLVVRLPDLLSQWERTVAEVAAEPSATRRLRLGAIELYSRQMAEHLVAALPDVELDWLVDDSQALVALLDSGRLDVALIADFPGQASPMPSNVHVATVVREPIWVQIGRVHPLGDAEAVDLSELTDECWVVSPPSQSPHRWEMEVLGQFPRARVVPSSQIAGRSMIDDGQAVAFSSALARSGNEYRVVPLTGVTGDRHIYLAWTAEAVEALTIKQVRDAMLGFYRLQCRQSTAYWDWITRSPRRFPGLVDGHTSPIAQPEFPHSTR